MKNFTFIAIFFLFMMGCKPGVPKNIIQPDEMALVLHDIHIFDGYITTITNIDTARVVAAAYYNGIYKKFNIDSALYAKSLDYYTRHPKIMDQIYIKVTDKLGKERKVLMRADSLATLKSAKALKAKMKVDSVKRSDSLKIDAERKKLHRQLDSLEKLRLSPKAKVKSRAIIKKRADSLKMVRKRDSLKKAGKLKKITKVNSTK